MEVVLGPVRTESMAAFVAFGRGVLESQGPGAEVPSDAARSFFAYLDEWAELSRKGGETTWRGEAEPEVVEYLIYAFWRVAKEVRDEAGDVTVIPEDAAPFYWVLVGALLDALDAAGGSHAELATSLREFWPGGENIP